MSGGLAITKTVSFGRFIRESFILLNFLNSNNTLFIFEVTIPFIYLFSAIKAGITLFMA